MLKPYFQPLKVVSNKGLTKIGLPDNLEDLSVILVTTEERLLSTKSALPQIEQYENGPSHPDVDAILTAEVADVADVADVAITVSVLSAAAESMHLQPGLEVLQSEIETNPTEPEFITTALIEKVVATGENVRSLVGLKRVETTIILLNNGMAYTGLSKPPGEIELPVSLDFIADSDEWTTWRQNVSGEIYLQHPAGEKLLVGEEITIGGVSSNDIAGSHTKITAETYGASQITTWSDLIFNEDGSFELNKAVLTTTGGADTLLVDTFTSSIEYHSANGSRAAVTGKTELSGTDDFTAITNRLETQKPNEHLFGTYSLLEDGLTIELSFANGVVQRELFYRGENYVHFGDSSYRTRAEEISGIDLIRELAAGPAQGGSHVWLTLMADSFAVAATRSESAQAFAKQAFEKPAKN